MCFVFCFCLLDHTVFMKEREREKLLKSGTFLFFFSFFLSSSNKKIYYKLLKTLVCVTRPQKHIREIVCIHCVSIEMERKKRVSPILSPYLESIYLLFPSLKKSTKHSNLCHLFIHHLMGNRVKVTFLQPCLLPP